MLGQEAVPSKANELTVIPALLARLAEQDGLQGALVSIAAIAKALRDGGADYLLAVKANQPGLRAEVEACFATAAADRVQTDITHDEGMAASNSAPSASCGRSIGGPATVASPLDVIFGDDQARLRKASRQRTWPSSVTSP